MFSPFKYIDVALFQIDKVNEEKGNIEFIWCLHCYIGRGGKLLLDSQISYFLKSFWGNYHFAYVNNLYFLISGGGGLIIHPRRHYYRPSDRYDNVDI